MNTASALSLLVLTICVISMRRRAALLAMFIGILFLSQASSFTLVGVNFFPARVLALVCVLRVLARRELSFRNLNRLDRPLLLLYGYTAFIEIISGHTQLDTVARCIDTLAYYFSFRGLIVDTQDVRWLIRRVLLLLGPYVLLLGIERFTHYNPFIALGAEQHIWMRGDRIRCFGSFRNPTILGSLGATFFPLYVAMFWYPGDKARAITGVLLCLAIVGLSNSGGPLGALMVAILGWGFWSVRMHLRQIRWAAVALLAALAMVMKAPVFYLVGRVSSITGGDGWHRAHLMDMASQDIGKWWLTGMPITETKHWFAYFLKATGGADITNQFVYFAITGGAGALILAIWVFAAGFTGLGRAMAFERNSNAFGDASERLLWGVGVALAVHAVSWLGISYFDQFAAIWSLHMAFAAVLAFSSSPLQATEAEAFAAGYSGAAASELKTILSGTKSAHQHHEPGGVASFVAHL